MSLLFPSREWCLAAAKAMDADPTVQAAARDFGPVVAGVVIERGEALEADFCVLTRVTPGRPSELSFPADEDELEEMEPDYLGWISYSLARELLETAYAGRRPDPLQAILQRRIRLHGDLERLVKHAGRHQGAGLDALRSIPTRFV